MRTAFFFTRTALRPDPPGEPLYTFDEIAEKLGITPGMLKKLRMQYPGLNAWRDRAASVRAESRWRLSDAKRWYFKIPKKMG